MNTIPTPLPIQRPIRPIRKRKLLAITSLGLAGLLAGLLTSCSGGTEAVSSANTQSYAGITGNWRFASGSTGGLILAGALSANNNIVSGRLHAVAGACASSLSTSFPVSGSVDTEGNVVLSAANIAGGSLEIAGVLAPDQHSLVSPTLTMTGGSCATAKERDAVTSRGQGGGTAVQYQAVTGNYTGTFIDSSGASMAVDATLSQPTTPDANGVYHLTGTATFASAPCIGSPVVTDSTVTGDQLSTTYTDAGSGATVIASGTFSSDARTLTITSWTLSGNCGADSGLGTLTQ